ncbi:MAG TPA: peptidylprolyl isomerase [Casimicrobium huifangae]|nr:peptidylprolyl isomerase [Casimicrobium huifangae]HQA35221.1 peptidylprolyl isomerase [Casimicrobium huifangae]HQD65764.1 peptidylprolyl isomerase [Casimicrobium huifangae]
MKKLLQLAAAGIAALTLLAPAAHAEDKPRVEMKTSLGTMVIELDPAAAPKTVANFLEYVKAGYYDGTIFHRVIKGFMIQGGGFTAEMTEKKTREPIENEAEKAKKAGMKNDRGTIAMARTGAPHSATAQFFINHVNNDRLTHPSFDGWGYTAFGKVVSGIEVIDKIAELPTSTKGMHQNVPQTTVTIEKVTLLGKK